MKKAAIWAGVIGVLIALFSVIGATTAFTNPSEIELVNVATIISAIFNLALGAGLVMTYFVIKKDDDKGVVPVSVEPNSPEDIKNLEKVRNWVVAFYIFWQIAASVQVWVLNNYGAGMTIVNLTVIFDLIVNIALFILSVQLLRGKTNVLIPILLAVGLMVVVESTSAFLRTGWAQAVTVLTWLPYFLYAIKAPMNRTNFRIAHFFVLPAMMILGIAFSTISDAYITQLTKEDSQLSQQYGTQNSVTAQAYTVFLQKNLPTEIDIQNVRDALDKGNKNVTEILAVVEKARVEQEKQLPNIPQQKYLGHLKTYAEFLNANVEQANKMKEFMDYASDVDFANMTEKQAEALNAYKQEVDSYNEIITELSFKLGTDML